MLQRLLRECADWIENEVSIAFVAFEIGFEFPVIGYLTHFVLQFLCVEATDVPEF